jgi:hypothetical protein
MLSRKGDCELSIVSLAFLDTHLMAAHGGRRIGGSDTVQLTNHNFCVFTFPTFEAISL